LLIPGKKDHDYIICKRFLTFDPAIFAGYKMENLLKKLNYRGQERICILNANNGFIEEFENARPSVRVDREIDPKFLYEF